MPVHRAAVRGFPRCAPAGTLTGMPTDVSPQTPQLAHARSILAAAAIAGAQVTPRDLAVLDFGDALAIIAGVIPPLPLPVPAGAGENVSREAAVAALGEAIAAAIDVDEMLRLVEASRALTEAAPA